MGGFKYLKPHRRRPPHPPTLLPRFADACLPAELCGHTDQVGPLDPSLKHQDLRSSRVERVGNWLLQTDEFINWDTGEDGVAKSVFFCYGDPGVGKTHIGSLVIDTLRNRRLEGQAVTYLYCDSQIHKAQSTAHILSAILKQVEHIPQKIGAFGGPRKQLDDPEIESDEILKLLISSLNTMQKSYICIDALDALPREYRPELFKSLMRVTQESPNTRLFLTSRQHIREEIGRYFTRRVEIRIEPTEEDIRNFLTMGFRNDIRPQAMNSDLREEILRAIPEKIPKTILLVSLSMNAILAQPTIRQRREVLKQMASGQEMDGVYAVILEQIIGQGGGKGKLGMGVLMWVSQSERPLDPEELRYALAIEDDPTGLDPENMPTIETLLSYCLGLATVDEEGSRVRLIHLTLQEYLGRHPKIFGSSQAKMADVCLIYLNSPTIQELPPNLWKHLGKIPFLDYASCYWGVYAKQELTERTKSLALQLLGQYEHHVSAKIFQVNQRFWTYYDDRYAPSRFTGLHAIACLGITEIATALIQLGGYDVNGMDSLGCTPLMWAARNNNRGVFEVLLKLGDTDPNIADSRGETPLLMASVDGHEDIVKLLLERKDVIADSHNNSGQTPLSVAARNGHEGIVKLLRELRDVNPHSSGNGGQSLLSLPTEYGNEGAMEPCFERPYVNSGSSEGCIRKTSSPIPTLVGYAHSPKVISRLFPDDYLQSQSPAPKDGSVDPLKNLERMSGRRGCTPRKAWWTWLTKCCEKR